MEIKDFSERPNGERLMPSDTLEQLLSRKANQEIDDQFGVPESFTDKVISDNVSEKSPEEVATELADMNATPEQINDTLSRLPDREAAQARALIPLAQEKKAPKPVYAPIRGFPKPVIGDTGRPAKKAKIKKKIKRSTTHSLVDELIFGR